jgi:23S rRNA (uracil1939-C5)-methyltransferase
LTTPGETVTIESLAAGGAGVAHLADGMIAFVPRTAPGDRVRLGMVRRHRRHAEALPSAIESPGPDRVEPPCPHFTRDRCGGCQWQHLSMEAQAAAKRRIIGDALRRIGGLDLPDPELVPSPRPFGYRATMTLTVRRRGGGDPVIGFHDGVDPDRVFPLDHCAIAREELNALWRAVRDEAGVLPRGDDVRLRLRIEADGARHLLVSGGEGAWPTGGLLADAAGRAGIPATVWSQPEGGAVRRVAGVEGDPAGVAFGQVNPEVAALLRDDVLDHAARPPAGTPSTVRILDLYAGAGETAIPLAVEGRQVVLVESDARAVRRAEERAAAAGARLRCIAGRVEEYLGALLPAGVVIVNPPRAGLGQTVTDRLREVMPPRLIYVSCDPATLARDLRRLGVGKDRVRLLRAYDMFPQTSHVETLVVVEAAA